MYLIDRGELLMQMMHKFHYELPDGCNNSLYGDVIKVIEDAPLIEAESVRHGSIIETIENGRMKRVFSCCGADFTKMTCWMTPNYCPNCGCRMDGGDDE